MEAWEEFHTHRACFYSIHSIIGYHGSIDHRGNNQSYQDLVQLRIMYSSFSTVPPVNSLPRFLSRVALRPNKYNWAGRFGDFLSAISVLRYSARWIGK